MAPRDTENNAYAKFWGDKQRALWYVMVFLEWSIVVFLTFSLPSASLDLKVPITKDEKGPGEPWNMRSRDPSLW